MNQDSFTGRERRTYVRVDTSLAVYFEIEDETPRTLYSAVTHNISHGGLCMEIADCAGGLADTLQSRKPPLRVSLQFADSGGRVELAANLQWTRSRIDWVKKAPKKSGLLVGVAFRELDDATREKIRAHIVSQFVGGYETPDQ